MFEVESPALPLGTLCKLIFPSSRNARNTETQSKPHGL